jgi:hypothetical protein
MAAQVKNLDEHRKYDEKETVEHCCQKLPFLSIKDLLKTQKFGSNLKHFTWAKRRRNLESSMAAAFALSANGFISPVFWQQNSLLLGPEDLCQ